MAATPAGRQLTEQHRRGQIAVRASVLRRLVALWPLFDPARIDESWRPLATAVMAVVGQGRSDSAALAAAYYQAYRTAEGVPGPMPAVSTAPAAGWEAAAQVAIEVTGPVRAKQLTALRRADVAAQTLVSLSGAASRIALNGGRATVLTAVERDPRAIGWARVTDGSPCAFCAMLAGRGGVYSKRTVDFEAHDHCSCTSEPVYRDGALPGRGAEFAQLWRDSTSGVESGQLLNAFRRAYEGR
ncbi:MAG: hypothetical protein AB7L91_06330 [Dehalococcoidia bacterium]